MELAFKPLNAKTMPSVAHLMTYAEQAAILNSNNVKGLAAFTSDGIGVGVLLFSQQQSGLVLLQSIVVTPSWRRCGIGTAMLKKLQQLARKANGVLSCPFTADGIRDPIYRFLASTQIFNFMRQPGAVLCVKREDVERACAGLPFSKAEPLYFFQQRPMAINAFVQKISSIYPAVASELSCWPDSFSKGLSFCSYVHGEITVAALLKQVGDRAFLHLLRTHQSDPKSCMTVLTNMMLAFCVSPDLNQLVIPASTPEMIKIFDKIFKTYQVTQQFYNAYDAGKDL